MLLLTNTTRPSASVISWALLMSPPDIGRDDRTHCPWHAPPPLQLMPGHHTSRACDAGVRVGHGSRLADIKHALEAVDIAIVGIRHVGVGRRSWVELAQQVHLGARLGVGSQAHQVGEVLAVERQHIVEAREVRALELARHAGQGHAPSRPRGLAALIARLAHVPGTCARAVDLDRAVETRLPHQMAHDRLGRGERQMLPMQTKLIAMRARLKSRGSDERRRIGALDCYVDQRASVLSVRRHDHGTEAVGATQ